MLSTQGPIAMSLPAPPDTEQETVPELCMKLQQAILRDGVVSPDDQRALGGLVESIRAHAEQQATQQMAGQPPAEDGGVGPAFATEGTEPIGGPAEGAEYVPFQ